MKAMTLTFVIMIGFLSGCKSSTPKTRNEVDVSQNWTSRMQSMSESLANLLQMTLDPMAFNSPDNQRLLDMELNRLSQFSHDVSAMQKKPSDDPGMTVVARQFSADMQEARRQLASGNRAYARHLIRDTTNYCISCHTQSQQGPQFQFSGARAIARMNSFDRAQFLFAVRHFDEGLEAFQKAMQSSDLALQSYPNLESATLKALAVAVRVKQDPKLADTVLTYVVQSKWAPVYLQISALKWRDSVREWQKASSKAKTLADAKGLVNRGWRKQMESPLSRAGLVEQLRASALLHELLAQHKSGKTYAETLYYAGLTSEALKDLDLFSLSENYYESCIRQLPRSETARNCYLRLEGLTLANYSHFEAVPLPSGVRQHLDELKKMAESQENSWSNSGQRR